MTDLTVMNQTSGDDWNLYHGDCVALATQIPDNSVDLTVYSPPFSSLYIYGDSEADMGNTDSDAQFLEQYRYLVREKYRATRPGRISAVHIKDLVYYQGSSGDGSAGIRPLSDEVTRVHLEEGWKLACRITIWRDPVLERSKTNAHGLLWKTFQSDASLCRVGMPEYLLIFRKWPHTDQEAEQQRPVIHTKQDVPLERWQELASPVWPVGTEDWLDGKPLPPVWNYAGQLDPEKGPTRGQSGGGDLDLKATETLNVQQARDPSAEKHLCPMPLNITRRAIVLYSNPDEVVWSPFTGIGSEGVQALRLGRRFIGTELNPTYYGYAAGHLQSASREGQQNDLFAVS